ncbi:MAG: hypothetical protein JO101_06515 [Candidatus Eremiobacteraeota bacterium]|nr:hypothetical protein [Candidatus Eremiobacteraeota bacterium]
MDVATLLHGESWCAIGAVATRAYMPERSTKDIDILVVAERRPHLRKALVESGWKEGAELHFPGSSLGLSGSTFMKDQTEIDIISSEQPWAIEALRTPQFDQTGLCVIPLPYLILMKLDAARAIDQGDLSRMLGRVTEKDLEPIIAVAKKYLREPEIESDIRQYAELGRLERIQTRAEERK